MSRALAAVLAALALAAPAAAFRLTDGIPLFLRIEGRVGPPQDVTRGATTWQLLGRADDGSPFQVTHLVVMSGDASALDVLDALRPYQSRVRLYGPKELLADLARATPADAVTVLGYLVGTPATAQLMVSQVTVTPPVPATPPAP